jgi:hypothetical protein
MDKESSTRCNLFKAIREETSEGKKKSAHDVLKKAEHRIHAERNEAVCRYLL